MKKALLILTSTALLASCKKDDGLQTAQQSLNATVKQGVFYEYPLGTFGDEESASIPMQAVNFDTSEIQFDKNRINAVYRYLPAKGFTGTDEVVIRSERGSNGASAGNNIIITRIRLTVTP